MPDEPETLVCFDLARPIPPSPRRLVRRLGPNDLDAVAQIHAAVWGPEAGSQVETLRRTLRAMPDRLSIHLAEDDDGGGFPTARIVFTPNQVDNYRIIATSFGNGSTGQFTITVDER